MKRGTSLIASYLYDDVGNRTTLTFGNGSSEEFAYETADPRYRLSEIDYYYKCDANSSIANQGGLDFTRDKSGNPLTWGTFEYSKAYEYDNNSRLVSANYPGQGTTSWSYDWVGNRTNTNYSYNAADQLTASPNKAYTYDDAGNLTALTGTGAKTFTYTNNNLVNSIQHNGGPSSSMVWDKSGNRVSFTSSTGGTYNYLYDTTAGIPAVIEEVTPSSSIYYVREPDGNLIASVNGETTRFYHFDELGSTLFMTDSNAVVSDRYTYDIWGNVTSHTGNTSQPYQYIGQLGYYTHYQDVNLPYIQTGVRLYDPEFGRFMQVDPIGLLGPDYTYSDNCPSNGVDPSGLLRWPPGQKSKCPNYDLARAIIIKALQKSTCRKYFKNLGCTIGGSNDPFIKGQGPRVIIGDPRWGDDWGKPHNNVEGSYGSCTCGGPRSGDMIINRSLCHGSGNARALAATWAHESAHWCVCRAMQAGMPGAEPGDGDSYAGVPSGSYPGTGEGFAAERACFGGVVF